MNDTVEFYEDGHQRPFLIVNSSFQPNDDDLVNIKKQTWKVIGRSFTVDYADDFQNRKMRCVVIVEKWNGTDAASERK